MEDARTVRLLENLAEEFNQLSLRNNLAYIYSPNSMRLIYRTRLSKLIKGES
jgi:hypothetical protein